MNQKAFCTICALIFFFVSIAHLSRVVTHWDVVIAGWVVPQWVSIPGLVIPGLLSVWGFVLAARSGARRKYTM